MENVIENKDANFNVSYHADAAEEVKKEQFRQVLYSQIGEDREVFAFLEQKIQELKNLELEQNKDFSLNEMVAEIASYYNSVKESVASNPELSDEAKLKIDSIDNYLTQVDALLNKKDEFTQRNFDNVQLALRHVYQAFRNADIDMNDLAVVSNEAVQEALYNGGDLVNIVKEIEETSLEAAKLVLDDKSIEKIANDNPKDLDNLPDNVENVAQAQNGYTREKLENYAEDEIMQQQNIARQHNVAFSLNNDVMKQEQDKIDQELLRQQELTNQQNQENNPSRRM